MNYEARYSHSWALVIGIDDYSHCSPLGNACSDAQTFAEALKSHAGFPASNVRLLLNKNATKAQILRHYLAFRECCAADDRLVVFFAGHGHSVSGNRKQQGFLVPADGDSKDLGSLIRWQELLEGSELIPAKHFLFVMDACFSGLLMQRAAGGADSRFVSDMLQRYSRQAITAGKADQTVADGGGSSGENSIFTSHFVTGLRGAAADKKGIITATGAMNYAYRKVSQDPGSDQTPHYGHLEGDGDMILRFPSSAVIDVETSGDHLAEAISEVPEVPTAETSGQSSDAFIRANGYGDPLSPSFGKNPRTEKLIRRSRMDVSVAGAPSVAFFSITASPSGRLAKAPKLPQLVERLRAPSGGNEGRSPAWHALMPQEMRTTLHTVVLFDPDQTQKDHWNRFLSVDLAGNVELADSFHPVWLWKPQSGSDALFAVYWDYVALVGILLCSLELMRRAYLEMAYVGGVSITANLVNARGGYLVGYSESDGAEKKRWANPLSDEFRMFGRGKPRTCEDPHIQVGFQATQRDLHGEAAKKMADDFAEKVGFAFNWHEEFLACYNYGTRDFPWGQFLANW